MNTALSINNTLTFKDLKTYLFTLGFVAGNIILPQICHLIPQGGPMFLPIYFFTLLGAYRYGWSVGLLTAILSPIANNLLFSMPPSAILPSMIFKSVVLAFAAVFFAKIIDKVSLFAIVLTVLSSQLIGGLYDFFASSFDVAIRNLYVSIPGMLLQIFGVYLIIYKLQDTDNK